MLPRPISPLSFYQYLASHSFLIGLLPFYIPVYLWSEGFSLAYVSMLIGLSGFSFCAALRLWQHIATRFNLAHLLALSFLLEFIVVLLSACTSMGTQIIWLLGIANGFYNAFFWTTQRTLFLSLLGSNDSGKKYGSFQLFVAAFLKVGILAGGALLDVGGIAYLLLLSAVIGFLSSAWFYQKLPKTQKLVRLTTTTTLRNSLRFSDSKNSRCVFSIDGLFLFLESHFWTLSLFLLIKQDYSQLGITVVLLAIIFALLFFLLKNTIDRILGAAVYIIAVALYAAAWALRIYASNDMSMPWQLTLLVLITFCTSFFRLLFNKRFFDNAQQLAGPEYLLIKSYLSQFWLGCGYVLASLALFWGEPEPVTVLNSSYLIAALLSFVYLLYRPYASST